MKKNVYLIEELVRCKFNGVRVGKVVKSDENTTTVLIDGEYINFPTSNLEKIEYVLKD